MDRRESWNAVRVLPPPRRRSPAREGLTPAQQRALDMIKEEPGCSIRRVAIRLRVSHATASYHLFALARFGLVVQVRDGREVRHFAGSRAPEPSDYLAAFLRDPVKAKVLGLLAHAGGQMSIHQVSRALGVPFGTVKRILHQLHALELVLMERRHFRYSVRLNPAKLEGVLTALDMSKPLLR